MPQPPTSNGSGHAEIMAALAQQTQMIQMLMNRVQALEGKGAGSHNPISQPAYTPQNSASSGIPSDQMCRFGNGCTRPQCWYQHPNSERTERNSTEAPRPNATRPKKPCHKGMSCTRANCRYEHPTGWDPSGASSGSYSQPDINTWGPPEPQTQPEASGWGPSEPQTQPEANTWGPSEPHSQPDTNTWAPSEDNASGWDDGANLSSWADKPNNDWGDPSSVWAPSNSDSTWGTTQSQGQANSAQSRRGESANSELGASSSRGRAPSVLSGSTATNSNSSSKGKKKKTPEAKQREAERQARKKAKKAERLTTESTAASADATSEPSTSADTSFEQSMSAEMPPNQSTPVDPPLDQPTSADTPDQQDSPSEQSAEMPPNESTFVDTPLDESAPADPPCDQSTSVEVLPDQLASVDTPNQPTPADTPGQLTPAATPLQSTSALPSEPADQPLMSDEQDDVTSAPEEISDFQDTPALESSTPPIASSSSESDEPETPSRLVWSDEPVTVVDFADTPSDNYLASESPAHHSDSWAPEFDDNLEEAEAQPNLDNTPSAIYGNWDNVQPSAADWGFDTSGFSSPPEAEKKPESRKKTGSKSKGKSKAIEEAKSSFNYQPKDIGAPGNASSKPKSEAKSKSEAKTKSSVPSAPALPIPTPTLDPPQGVPEEDIPDWLLGGDMDAHATFGISRSATPEPTSSSGPPRLASTKPTRAPKLSHLSGEDFPTPGQAIPIAHLTAKANAPPKPTIRARPPAWKIIPSSDTSSTGGNRNNKAKGGSGKNGGGKKKAAA